MTRIVMSCVFGALILAGAGCGTQEVNIEAEKVEIENVINASIGWAKTKDTDLLYGSFASDEDLFWFTPEGGINRGIADLQKTTETIFLDEAFVAISHEIRELFIGLAQSGDVAWFHCILDDENTFNGQPFSWIDVRWTGVLERRDGRWVIVQQHFSNACT